MWKYGSGMDRVDTFRILEADVAKWEKKCEALRNEGSSSGDGSGGMQVGPSNDIRNEINLENINSFENNSLDNVNLNISNGVMPLQYYTNEYQISNSGVSAVTNAGPSMYGVVSTLPVRAHSGSQNIPQVLALAPQLAGVTQVPALTPQMAGGNVHTGAPPPWLEATEENQLNVQQKPISSRSVPVSNKSGKSHKLNPKRVGAAWAERRKMEMEMEKRGEMVKSDCNANWLPNFGRVWQSGSRKESRKEFEKEKRKLPNVESHTEMPITIQPYISKRMALDWHALDSCVDKKMSWHLKQSSICAWIKNVTD
ncbi:unnamed protein product [Dovyalis caffra]|uniref:Uncharacterized protein n=1 Tax=Dovyalis caffra TaxID=77055 RepID=A0AAV1RIZ2_9ROSI|nr:unnamed protein product [Dovyalis caffra]